MRPTVPCKNCNKRTTSCHSNCDDYASFKNKMDYHNVNSKKTIDPGYVKYPKCK